MGGVNGTSAGPGRIVVAGSVAQKPRHGGHTWVFLQYALGLKRLGWEVLLLDRLAPAMCADEGGRPCSAEESWNLRYASRVMERFGRNVGRPECPIPDCGKRWITTNQPIVLEHWPPADPGDGPFTSIGTWRGRYDPIEYGGERYGLRVHAFRAFAPLPRLSGEAFELALDIDAVERADLALLEENGWALVDPRRAAADPWSYRDYIARSGAEFMVSKDAYVRSRSGWFSDRSVCYLASGRPVVAQDTGFDGWYPTGEGLLAFNDLDEATAAVEEVSGDRRRHSVAARRIAEECFDSDRVLTGLLDALSVEGA